MFYKQRFNEIKDLLLAEEERFRQVSSLMISERDHELIRFFRQNAKDIAEIEAGEWDERIALDLGVATPSKPPMSPMIPTPAIAETPNSPDKPIALQTHTQPSTELKPTLPVTTYPNILC